MFTKKELGKMGCQDPSCKNKECNEVYFHGRCHPFSPTWTFYDKEKEQLIVECAVCREVVARFDLKEE